MWASGVRAAIAADAADAAVAVGRTRCGCRLRAVAALGGQLPQRQVQIAEHGRRRLVAAARIEHHRLVDDQGHPVRQRRIDLLDGGHFQEALLAQPLQAIAGFGQRGHAVSMW